MSSVKGDENIHKKEAYGTLWTKYLKNCLS